MVYIEKLHSVQLLYHFIHQSFCRPGLYQILSPDSAPTRSLVGSPHQISNNIHIPLTILTST